MGSCTRRHFLLSTCFLQMISVIERQVFDFLGYMWAPICVNFFHIIFVIFGFYGAYHFRIKYIITYLIWNFLWIAWNSFLICFYLNVGELDRDSDLLNLGTGSVSWFEVNGYGCKPTYPTNITSDDPFRPIRPERVDDCLLDYTIVEVVQAGVQCGLALLGILGAILISTIFLDEDDRFDFMNGDAKSPQHTVVHPMYVSYTSIPTSASATMQSNKQHINYNNHNSHHQQQQQQQNSQQHHQTQQQAINQNTFLTYTNSNYNSSGSRSYIKKQLNSNNSNSISNSNSNINTPIASKNNTLTRVLYTQKNNRIAASTTSIMPIASNTAAMQDQQQQLYYDDSTAKADQLYTNSNRRQQLPTMGVAGSGIYQQQQQQQAVLTPNSSHDNTTSSLSYASLQNSNLYLAQGGGLRSGRSSALGGACGMSTPLSNSNYSINSNNTNNNHSSVNNNNSGRFARIHSKPKPPKSTSYSSFINGTSSAGGNAGSASNLHRPDVKYTQMSSDRMSRNFDENLEDDNFSLQNLKNDDGLTYIPFQKPTPGNLFINKNNNPSYTSLNSYASATTGTDRNNQQTPSSSVSPNNNTAQAPFSILLEHGAILEPAMEPPQIPATPPILNPANRFLYQQNGLPFHPAYSPTPYRAHPKRPTNIPLPTVPTHSFAMPISPSEVTPPPPPAPRPHIFQPRCGHAPYPDLSPEVTEKYAMPTQYVPRSPVATRIARRQRQQRDTERNQLVNNSVNFCDQIRDTPPGFPDTGFIMRARSQDRLSSSVRENKSNRDTNAAPHVNRRSGRRDGKARPRSYCNSLIAGEGVIRTNIAADRNLSNGARATTNASDESVRHVNKKAKHRQSLYSIEFGPSIDTIRSRTDTILDYDDEQANDRDGSELSPKPMTPRRVKRRSVMARGTNSRQSGTSRRSTHSGTHKHNSAGGSNSQTNTYSRSSMRHSRRKYQQNPVTKLLDQQQDQLQKQHKHHAARDYSTYSKQLPQQPPLPQQQQQFGSFHHKDNASLTTTNLQMLNQEILINTNPTNNILASGSLTKNNNNHYHSFRKNIPPDPIYYNTNGQAGLYQQSWQLHNQSPVATDEAPNSPTTPTLTGHFNPTYQHSTTNLNDVENIDEVYNNRPPSVRSSYSNFHGARPLSTAFMSSASVTENVFAGLPGTIPHQHHHDKQQQQQQQQIQQQQQQPQQQQQQYAAPSTPPLYATNHQHLPLPSPNFPTTPPQNIPFTKRTASRESIRSMAFLNSGPPAYNLNYHTPPDSETTM